MSQPIPANPRPQPALPQLDRSHGLVAAFAAKEFLRLALEDLYVAGVPAGVVTVLGRGEPPQGGVPADETLADLAGGQALVLAEGLAGLVAGLGLGTAIGGLLHGRHEAHHRALWEGVLDGGGWLLNVHGTEAEYLKAVQVLQRHHPAHVDHFLLESRP